MEVNVKVKNKVKKLKEQYPYNFMNNVGLEQQLERWLQEMYNLGFADGYAERINEEIYDKDEKGID